MTQVIAGRYELLEPLGHHGTGLVWHARDRVLDREVAVQEVSADRLGADPAGRLASIVREARAATRLDHPGIVTVHDAVEEDGRPWIVVRLVRARSLATIVERDGPLPPERVAAIGLELLDALRAAHAAGIVHRDVAPGHVLLSAGRPVLTGFGVAAGEPLARPAPERAAGHPASPASDLWSLGATLYATVEGRPPFPDGPPAAEPDPPRLAGPLTPVLHGLLRAAPEQRIGPEEAEQLLRRVLGHGTASETPASTPPPFPPPFPPAFPPPPPPMPQPAYVPPGAPSAGPPPRTGPRWSIIVPIGVLAIVFLAAAIAAGLLLTLREDTGRTASGAPSGELSSRPPSTSPYRVHYGEGYTVNVPSGWSASPEDDGMLFSDPDAAVIRSISLQRVIAADDAAAGADVVEALEDAAESFAADPVTYPGYRRERFTELRYLGDDAAELQFTFSAADVESRMRMRLFRFDGAIYSAIVTAQLDEWNAVVPHYETFLRTFRPLS
ncbi:serine/threonine-protein kinase [Actinomadura algeriensis]|uniref:non-specific serine/threonine protein kinase n=1 Tax=Actinomadura algeriensis TaxID=1679523 RepID=A0ABR9JV49_9ACTN|nr:serine/threonine-protein kinase [Actinomadura algeriensis]MBE1534439.1 serine/threonine protein kinase [Actinomadura algeriensis]